ncbi:T5orf172 domain [Mycoplasmopsis bovigenitalium]|uniref:T5orf172 domain n=1 Tax=Mycoplasmopsis bovigenitalium TaxID=2112 RepID=A0A449AAA8_9BACT|nr:DUF4357 domain-containing protein [Mycoplasmopsis bovigenitalium]VEU61144.1 T5orf172 domain [Mycoplasmopsis bovigenitalium]
MSKGIIYLMSTVVSGVVKIGKTSSDQFENRMRILEGNGYANIVGLKREFAIEVDSYDEKEKLIHNIFSKSRIANTELFALDIETIKLLLSSFEGKEIYPQNKTKEEVFKDSTEIIHTKCIPNGEYFLERNVKGFGRVEGHARVRDGVFTLLKGSYCADYNDKYPSQLRKNAKFKNNFLQEDIICKSPSAASLIVVGKSTNGWDWWKNIDGESIKIYRKKEISD